MTLGELSRELHALKRLYLRVAARVRRRVPLHAQDEIIDEVLVRVFVRELKTGGLESREALALHMADGACASWYRRWARHGTVPLPSDLPEGMGVRAPCGLHRLRDRLAQLAPRLAPLLTPRQRDLLNLACSGEIPSLSYASKQMKMSLKDLRGMACLIAKKIKMLEPNAQEESTPGWAAT
jgi:hypothetical protein